MNLLRDPDNYGKRKSCQRSIVWDKRAITPNSNSTAREIAENAEVANVRGLLKNREHLKRRELQRKPWLKQELCRLQFAEKRVYTSERRKCFYMFYILHLRYYHREKSNNSRVVGPWEAV